MRTSLNTDGTLRIGVSTTMGFRNFCRYESIMKEGINYGI